MTEFLQLFRSLTLGQLLLVEAAWVGTLGGVFFFVVWRAERALRAPLGDDVAWQYGVHWDLGPLQIAAVLILLLVPLIAWLLMRARRLPADRL